MSALFGGSQLEWEAGCWWDVMPPKQVVVPGPRQVFFHSAAVRLLGRGLDPPAAEPVELRDSADPCYLDGKKVGSSTSVAQRYVNVDSRFAAFRAAVPV